MNDHILIVDDEQAIREMVCFALQPAGYQCLQAANTSEASHIISSQRPALILLDWMLPETSGIEFARQLRSRELYQDIPIIMLTARTEEHDKLKGFDSGCDDYVTKPFSTKELLARIQAVMRRSNPDQAGKPLTAGKLALDPASHRVTVNQQEITLGPTEFRLLKFFMSHPDRVYSRTQLLDYVWGESVYIEERTVDVHIRRLRRALEPAGQEALIQTVRGAGYRFSQKT